MSEIKLISPMLDSFCVGDPISDQNGVRSCPAMKENEDDRYILKVVSIPASQTKLDALLLAGAYPDADAAKAYFKELADDIVSEVQILNKLSEQGGFLPFLQYQVESMENGETGFDVYILTSYKRTLKRQFYKQPLTHLNAVNLGIDICDALTICRNAGYMYVDLKPTNIFVTSDNGYKISDLGFVKLDSLQFSSLQSQYRSAYTAPEIADAFSALSTTMDIYALGLVLYQAYNNGALPFSGEIAPHQVFPAPDYADYEMTEIILKACNPDPAQRWQEPSEMRQALINYMQRNGANDTPIVPVVPVFVSETAVTENTESTESEACTQTAVTEQTETEQSQISTESVEQDTEQTQVTGQVESEDEDSEKISGDAQATTDDASVYKEDELGNLSFLTDVDEDELMELGIQEQSYGAISEEVTEILEQADQLATHNVPDINSATENTSGNSETSSQTDDQNQGQVEQTGSSEAGEKQVEQKTGAESDSTDDEQTTEITDSDATQKTMIFESAENQEQDEKDDEQQEQDEKGDEQQEQIEEQEPVKPQKRRRGWLTALIIILILLGLAAGGYCVYKYYYIKTADIKKLEGKLDTLTVYVESDADPSLLTVYCIGNGNRTPADLVNGKAYFTNLEPDQRYTIEVGISGFHGFKEPVTATHYTPSQVALEGLQVKVGETDGSAQISFTTKKPYEGKWNAEYKAEGEESQSIVSDSENINLNNLTVGKTYSITITPADNQGWVTNNTVSFTALPLILAQNVTVAEYTDGNLTLTWQAPEGTSVSTWTVHCYNDTDYNKTVTVSDCSALFSDLDPLKSYTVELYAEQQSKGQLIHIDDATLPIDNFTAQLTEHKFVELTWTCSKEIPAEGWIIRYSMNGSDEAKTYTTTENKLLFKEAIPGCAYVFTIEAGNGAPVIATNAEITIPTAENFTSNYDDVPVTKDNITLKMCTPPDSDSWSYKSLYSSDYTTTLKVGEKAGFVTRVTKYYSPTNESEVFVLYVIKDEEGNIVMYNSEERVWANMWNYYYGALTIPELPDTAGKYTVEVYFNGGLVGSQAFEITE